MKRALLALLFALAFTASYAQTSPVDSLDYRILKTLQQHRTPVANRLWVSVSNSFPLAVLPTVGYAVGSACVSDAQQSQTLLGNTFQSGLALTINAAATMALKNILARPRPWVAYPDSLVCLQRVSSASFPSGHTSFAFTAAVTLSLLHPRWYVVLPAALWASAVGYSRLYIGAHYPSDVLAGAVIGTCSALLAHALCSRKQSTAAAPPVDILLPVAQLRF